MPYSDLSDKGVLNPQEMFEIKGGYVCYAYGCEKNVCAIKRSGAKDLCDTAYCRSGVGPETPPEPVEPDNPPKICIVST